MEEGGRIESDPVISHAQPEAALAAAQADLHLAGPGVLENVGQGFLGDPVQYNAPRRGWRRRARGNPAGNLQPGLLSEIFGQMPESAGETQDIQVGGAQPPGYPFQPLDRALQSAAGFPHLGQGRGCIPQFMFRQAQAGIEGHHHRPQPVVQLQGQFPLLFFTHLKDFAGKGFQVSLGKLQQLLLPMQSRFGFALFHHGADSLRQHCQQIPLLLQKRSLILDGPPGEIADLQFASQPAIDPDRTLLPPTRLPETRGLVLLIFQNGPGAGDFRVLPGRWD